METKINIAAILKDKPQGTKLYDWLYNIDVELDTISTTDTETVVWRTNETDNNTTCHRGYSEFGTVRGCTDGLQILLPSKEMRDWGQFAWKKGDVLMAGVDNICIFNKWNNDEYTEFDAAFVTPDYRSDVLKTKYWHNVINENVIKRYISKIEKNKGGKLNLTTLEIEKIQPEFKDGDIVALVVRKCTHIAIFQSRQEAYIGFHAVLCQNDELLLEEPFREDVGDIELRLATDSEKQQLFEALAKEGKCWNAEKKQIVSLKPKIELKPFDKVLSRRCSEDYWVLNFYSHKSHKTDYHICIDGSSNLYCIPYNEETAHLLGTTDDWEGGEV